MFLAAKSYRPLAAFFCLFRRRILTFYYFEVIILLDRKINLFVFGHAFFLVVPIHVLCLRTSGVISPFLGHVVFVLKLVALIFILYLL